MEVFKILLWCCIAVTITARRPQGMEVLSSTLSTVPHEQCYCIPKSVAGLRVSDLEVPQKERLIIYLYKDIFGEVTLHIPSPDKQSVLPDLPIDTNDILEGNVTYSVNDLFRSNMSHMLIRDDNIYPYTDTDSSVHNLYNLYVPTKPKVDGNGLWYPPSHSHIHSMMPKLDVHRGIGPAMDTDEFPLKEISNLYSTLSDDVVRPAKKGIDHVLYTMNMLDKKKQNPMSWISSKSIDPGLVDLSDVTGPEVHINTLPLKGFHTKQPHHLTSVLKEMVVPKQYLENKPHLNQFEFWLRSQMNNLKNNKSYAKFDIDIDTLKGLLIKTLQNNGIQTLYDVGLLIDSKGNRIRLDNVRLNPVFLGDPMEYSKRFAEKGCLSPQELPHIETVLMSASNPPRILGIIPLGDNLLASKSNTNIPICSQSNRKPGSRCRHISLVGKDENGPFSHNIVLNSLYRRKNGDDMNYLDSTLLSDETAISDNDEVSNVDMKSPKEVVTTVKEIGTDDDNDDDDLGIRVLGGNSATSSGAPLNNKGRSGLG